jgi:hypothetical protein
VRFINERNSKKMSINSKLGMMSMFAALAMMGTETPNRTREYEPKETDEERKRRLAKAEIERNKANGLKEFFYGENSVWAINQKNADKKARSKHWL